MGKKFRILLALILLLGVPLQSSAEVTQLDAFLLIVKNNNPTLQSSLRRLEAFYHTVRSAVAVQRPSAGLRGSTSWNSDSESPRGQPGKYSLGAAISHRFDVSGVYRAQERQLLLQYNGMAADHMALVNNTLASAESLYWQAFIARENILLQKGILSQRKEDLRITEEKYKQQLIPRLDVIRAQAKVEEAESLVVDAESVYRNTLAQLATLAGGDEIVPAEETLLVPSLSIDPEVEKALGLRNDVRALEIALERAKVMKSLAAKGMAPVLEGSVGYTFLTDSDNTSPAE